MMNIKETIEDIISMYAIVDDDIIYPRRGPAWLGAETFWDEDIIATVERVFGIDVSIKYFYSDKKSDCFTIEWQEGHESHRVFVKVFRD